MCTAAPPVAILASDFSRAFETAKLVAAAVGADVEAAPALREPATRRALEDLARRWLSYRSFAARGLGPAGRGPGRGRRATAARCHGALRADAAMLPPRGPAKSTCCLLPAAS